MKDDVKLFGMLSEKTRTELNSFSDLLEESTGDQEISKKFSDLIQRVIVESYYTSKEKIIFNPNGKD
jgi:hypothetical protein